MDRLRKALTLTAAVALLVPGAALAGSITFHHHRADHDGEEQDHYKDKGAKPSKASVGNLTLRSRTLIGKDGKTDLEVSTAAFDTGATAPGNISHVHIRAVEPDGRERDEGEKNEKRFRREYNHLRQGGYVKWTYTELSHGQVLRIEAKARGAAHRDEAEAEWLDAVRYKPDLVVQKIDAPASARVNTAIDVYATLGEHMGEVGAHADCALYVDGVQVDLVPGMWVDAGTVATCHTVASIASSGPHTLMVKTQNEMPGDYDESNNTLSQQITVTNPVFAMFNGSASEDTAISSVTMDTYSSATLAAPDMHVSSTTTNVAQSRTFNGAIASAVNTPIKRIAFSDTSGGRSLSSFELVNVDLTPTAVEDPSFTSESVYADQDPVSGRLLILRRYFNANTNTGATCVSLAWTAGEVTFHSEKSCSNAALRCTPGDFTTNTITPTGTKVLLADDYAAQVVVDDGTPYSANPSMALTAFGSPVPVVSSACSPVRFGTVIGKRCITSSSAHYGKNGQVSVTNTQ